MLPVGFVGFGQQASAQHAWYLVNHGKSSARIVAVCDILADQASVTADRLKHLGCHDTAVYTMDADQARRPDDVSSVREMLAHHPEIEAVIISTPPAKHYHQARACLESGVNVLVDKPPALTYEHALHLTQLVNGNKPLLVVGSQRRYEDAYRYAKHVISAGELGRLLSVNAMTSHPGDWQHGWRLDPAISGGGCLWNFGWHLIDTLVFLTGTRAAQVEAAVHVPPGFRVETGAHALIEFDRAVYANVTINADAPSGSVYEAIQIWGTDGVLLLHRFKPTYDMYQPTVVHQLSDGTQRRVDFSASVGKRWAPTEAFMKLMTSTRAGGSSRHESDRESDREPDPTSVVMSGQVRSAQPTLSAGEQSVETVRIIEAIYRAGAARIRG